MESLNKQQLILLGLLVSFVTSIATGIVTVALYDRAPQSVTQTINRVVERTVERVVTEPSKAVASPVVTKETIVIREDDRVTDAVAKNTKGIVRIKQVIGTEQAFITLGLVVSADGLVASNILLSPSEYQYLGQLADGTVYHLVPVTLANQSSSFTFFRLVKPDGGKAEFNPVSLVSGDTVKLGQSVVSISGDMRDTVTTGLIQSLLQKDVKRPKENATSTDATETVKATYALDTNIRDMLIGSPLINLSGEVIGIKVPQYESAYLYAVTDNLKKDIEAILAIEAKKSVATTTASTR